MSRIKRILRKVKAERVEIYPLVSTIDPDSGADIVNHNTLSATITAFVNSTGSRARVEALTLQNTPEGDSITEVFTMHTDINDVVPELAWVRRIERDNIYYEVRSADDAKGKSLPLEHNKYYLVRVDNQQDV